jgi:hypothetical protein
MRRREFMTLLGSAVTWPAAKALGLDPSTSLLARTDEVIE